VHGRTVVLQRQDCADAQLEHPIIKGKSKERMSAIWRLSQLLSGLTERHELDMSYFFRLDVGGVWRI